MNRIVGCFLLIVLMVSGCVHTRVFSDQMPPDSLAQINQIFGNRAGHLDLWDSTRVDAKSFVFRADSTLCFVKHEDAPRAFPNRVIRHVVIPDRAQGMKDALRYGALPGAITGGALGLLIGTLVEMEQSNTRTASPPTGSDSLWHGEWKSIRPDRWAPLKGLALGAVIGGVTTGVAGLYVGAAQGSLFEVRYQFPSKNSQRAR